MSWKRETVGSEYNDYRAEERGDILGYKADWHGANIFVVDHEALQEAYGDAGAEGEYEPPGEGDSFGVEHGSVEQDEVIHGILKNMGWAVVDAADVGALTDSAIYVPPGHWHYRDDHEFTPDDDSIIVVDGICYMHDRYALEFFSEGLASGTVRLISGIDAKRDENGEIIWVEVSELDLKMKVASIALLEAQAAVLRVVEEMEDERGVPFTAKDMLWVHDAVEMGGKHLKLLQERYAKLSKQEGE